LIIGESFKKISKMRLSVPFEGYINKNYGGTMKMADEGTASTLVLVGAILELILFLAGIGLIAMTYMLFAPLIALDPTGLMMMAFLMTAVIYIVFDIFGIIFFILWFKWRSEPSAHKTALIVTGILGLFLAWFIPALLVLIAGIIAPGEAA
jgi:hypothetical protein